MHLVVTPIIFYLKCLWLHQRPHVFRVPDSSPFINVLHGFPCSICGLQDGRHFFYQAARAVNKASCEFWVNKIKGLNAAAGQKLADTPHNTWVMYASRGNCVWDQVTSNISETTNSMIGAEASAKLSVYSLFRSCCRFKPSPCTPSDFFSWLKAC